MSIPEILKTNMAKVMGVRLTDVLITLRKPLQFQSNRLYDIRADGYHFIAKEYLQPDEQEVAPLREYRALKLLSSLDIAPQPILFEPAIAPIVIYEYMEGEMWDRKRVTATDLSNLMEVWLKVNSVSVDWFSRGHERSLQAIEHEFHHHLKTYLDWTTTEFKAGERAAQMCLKLLGNRHFVIQELSNHVPLPCFCKTDPRFANVIQRPNGQLGLIDWEDSGLRDPARDLADVLIHPNQEDLVNWKDWQAFFVKPYIDVRSRIDKDIAMRMHLYLAVFPMFWLILIIRRGIKLISTGQLTDWTVNGLSGNERLRRYLARALAWPKMDYENVLEDLNSVEFFPDGCTR